MVVILLLYADDIVFLARCLSNLDKQLRVFKDFCSTMGMMVNTNKTKVMIIKSKNDIYDNFMYDNNNLEEVFSYKYLGIDIHNFCFLSVDNHTMVEQKYLRSLSCLLRSEGNLARRIISSA